MEALQLVALPLIIITGRNKALRKVIFCNSTGQLCPLSPGVIYFFAHTTFTLHWYRCVGHEYVVLFSFFCRCLCPSPPLFVKLLCTWAGYFSVISILWRMKTFNCWTAFLHQYFLFSYMFLFFRFHYRRFLTHTHTHTWGVIKLHWCNTWVMFHRLITFYWIHIL